MTEPALTPHEDPFAPLEPLRSLIYRFLWPFQYFRDVTRGSMMERQQAYRHNRAMRIYLPGFVLKWILLAASFLGIGTLFDSPAELVIPAACFATGIWTAIVAVMLSVAWLWLERFPELEG